MKEDELASAVRDVYSACYRLSKISNDLRPFTPDGRMVGDIGEVIAAFYYGVTLHKGGYHNWDGEYKGRMVQIKTTGGKETYLKEPPEDGYRDGLLLVFQINRQTGEFSQAYNGDIQRVWNALQNRKIDKSGAKMVGLDRLKQLQKEVDAKDVIPSSIDKTLLFQ